MKVLDETHVTIRRVEDLDRQLIGWVINTSHEGEMIWRFFTDRSYGGRQKAYRAAKLFAAEWGDRSEVQALLRRFKPRKNSRSGIPGVARYEGERGRGPFWAAYWNENGRKVQKRFPVSVYGEDKARELAMATREAGVRAYAERLEEVRRHDARVLERSGRRPKEVLQAAGEDASPTRGKRRSKFAKGGPTEVKPMVVLAVDDEPAVLGITAMRLRHAGYTVLEATSGDEALRVLESRDDVSVIVSDCNTPGLRGPDLARTVVARWPRIKYIATSGRPADPSLPDKVEFIHKPYRAQTLISRIEQHVSQ